MDKPPSAVSLEISRALSESGVSQSELAKKLGVARSQVSRWCSPNYYNHNLSSLRAIAEALDCELEVRLVKNQG